MPAFTFEGSAIKLSINYDSITFYSKSMLDDSKSCDDKNIQRPTTTTITLMLTACSQISFILSEPSDSLDDATIAIAAKGDKPDYQRNVYRDDNDHALYHEDQFSKDDPHYHLKFKGQITRNKIVTVLDILLQHQLMSAAEKTTFLNSYDQRFIAAEKLLQKSLTRVKAKDAVEIIRQIKSCADNDVIAHLHQHLTSKEFDYIRERTNSAASLCNGTDAKDSIIPTTSAWALIEESMTLKMADNIHSKCDVFPEDLAKEYDTELKSDHKFFGIDHYASPETASAKTSTNYSAFFKDSKHFSIIVNEHFQKLDKVIPVTPTAPTPSKSTEVNVSTNTKKRKRSKSADSFISNKKLKSEGQNTPVDAPSDTSTNSFRLNV